MASGSIGGYSVASLLGVVLGAVVGAGAESALQADRELKRQSFLRAQEAHNLWIEGRETGDVKKINMARRQLAAYGSKQQVLSVRKWMEYEHAQRKKAIAENSVDMAARFTPIGQCPDKTHPEMRFYMAARHGTNPPNFSLFSFVTSVKFEEDVSDDVVAEVAMRCFLKPTSN